MTNTGTFRIILRDYFDENFIFAARLITNARLTFIERFWWITWVVASIITCCLAAILMHQRWERDPMVITYGSQFMPITTVPFPAVTICPLIKSRADQFNSSEAYQLLRNGSGISTSSYEKMRALAHVCPVSSFWPPFKPSKYEEVVSILRQLAIPMDDSMSMCLWRLKRIPCEQLFSRTLIDDGICYTFNGLAANEIFRTEAISENFLNFTTKVETTTNWTQERGYPEQAGQHAYPRRPLAGGINSGLFALTRFRRDDNDISCNGAYSGFKVAIHAPDELSPTNFWYYRIGPSYGLSLVVKPEVFKISNRLRDFLPPRRYCFFAHERPLRYFKVYNQQNCFLECISNYTLIRCGCVKFSMPRAPGMRVCDASKINCYQTVYNSLIDFAIRVVMVGKLSVGCQCYPACNSIKYHAESYQVGLNFSKILATVNSFHSVVYDKHYDPAAMIISFKERHYLPLWRRELVSPIDALAKLGGLFALLLGASAMSLGEIVYFCFVRPLRRERQPRDPQLRIVEAWRGQNDNSI